MHLPKIINAFRIAYVYSLVITGFCMLIGVASILTRDGKSIGLITSVGVASAVILIASIIALHHFTGRQSQEDQADT
jgi:uncharacterized membrane protein (UPF0136 family)